MIEYQKIEGLYAREAETRQLLRGVYRDHAVEYLKDNLWYFTEKIDGTNIRVHWDGHTFEFGGRTDKAIIPDHLLKHLKEMFLTPQMEEVFEQVFGEKDVIIFGEGHGAKIQSGGDYTNGEVAFRAFDVMVNERYVQPITCCEVLRTLGIPQVPILLHGTIKDAEEFVQSRPMSTLGNHKHPMEGVVGKPELPIYMNDKRVVVKIKVRDFEELEKQEKRRSNA